MTSKTRFYISILQRQSRPQYEILMDDADAAIRHGGSLYALVALGQAKRLRRTLDAFISAMEPEAARLATDSDEVAA
jgi:hypothetical protein